MRIDTTHVCGNKSFWWPYYRKIILRKSALISRLMLDVTGHGTRGNCCTKSLKFSSSLINSDYNGIWEMWIKDYFSRKKLSSNIGIEPSPSKKSNCYPLEKWYYYWFDNF